MDNEFFMSTGFPPQTLFEPSSSAMPSWQALSSECFLNPSWENSTDPNVHFDSGLSSMVSSPADSNNNMSSENFVIRELTGNLGNSGDISPHANQGFLGTHSAYVSTNNSANNSCYSTPLNSPPKVNLLMTDHLMKENFTKLPNSMPLNSILEGFSGDPGFSERAAKFSCFSSRSFNGRTSQFGANHAELPCRTNSLMENRKLSIEALGSKMGAREKKRSNTPLPGRTEFASSLEESTVSEQKPNGESNSRKRKAISRGKAKVAEANDDLAAKRSKRNDNEENDDALVKADEEKKGNSDTAEDEKQTKADQKPPEPPKDYIHVRARRGQATDSHSLAERVRREKISERMKLLQDLVPGCNKVTGKALMLDEIINYVQSLQRQVEFISMKLATMNTRLDFNVNTLATKNTYQSNNPVFHMDSSTSAFYGHQPDPNPALSSNISGGTVTECSVDHLGSTLWHNLGMQLPPLNGFNQVIPQCSTFCENDLQTIVQMGFSKDQNQETALQSQSLEDSNQVHQMKIEL